MRGYLVLVQGACLQAGQLEMAAPSLAAAVSSGTISPSLVVPVPRPAAVTAVPTGEPVAAEVRGPLISIHLLCLGLVADLVLGFQQRGTRCQLL